MSRNALLVRLLAAVGAIAAIALAAATLESPVETGGGDGGFGSGDGDPGLQPPPSEQPNPGGVGEIPVVLEYLVYAILIVIAIVTVWYLIAYRREAVRLIAVVLAVTLVGVAIILFFMEGMPDPVQPDPPQPVNDTGGDGGTGGSGETESFSTGPILFVLAVITAIFVGGLLVSRNGGSGADETVSVEADEEADRSDAAAVASAAGRAADRIDDEDGTDVDNEIYRAWREMTDLLEVDRPESSTPREFARAAVDAGLSREHVDELTRLFEDVRYGDAETTPEMEARAVEVLRRIEETYAAENEGDSDGGSSRGESR